jgi:hypothetical protein
MLPLPFIFLIPHLFPLSRFLESPKRRSLCTASRMASIETDGLTVTYSSERTGIPDLRLIHYNDVYHVEYAIVPCCQVYFIE